MIAVLLAHTASTAFMIGVIWIVQVVHYPLFSGVGAEDFEAYAARHARLITYVVMPAMLVELGSAVALAIRPEPATAAAAYIGLGLVVLIWLSTFFIQVPLHERLAGGFDPQTHRALVNTNWIRTGLWSARGAVSLYMLHVALRAA